jgi:sulfonate transport system substrate-binding protein
VNNQVVLVPKGSPAQRFGGPEGQAHRLCEGDDLALHPAAPAGRGGPDLDRHHARGLSPQDGLAAFQSGALDAWVIYGVIVYQAREAGARVLTTGLGRLSGNYLITAAQEALDDPIRLQAIGDYVRRYRKVFDWINADGERWARVRSETTGVKALLCAGIQGAQRAFSAGSDQRRGHSLAAGGGRHLQQGGVIQAKIDVRPLWDKRIDPFF